MESKYPLLRSLLNCEARIDAKYTELELMNCRFRASDVLFDASSCVVSQRKMLLTFPSPVYVVTTFAVVAYVFLLSAEQIKRNSQEILRKCENY